MRDKSILKFERDKVNGVEVAAGPVSMTFTKQGDAWTLTHPYRARTDSTAIEGLLGRIGSGQMKSLAAQEATPADLHKYGLVKPAAIVTLLSESGRTGLMVGTPSPTSGAGAPALPRLQARLAAASRRVKACMRKTCRVRSSSPSTRRWPTI